MMRGHWVFFGYLGPLRIQPDPAVPVSPRLRTVLAVLLTRAGHPVPVDELAELTWDGSPPQGAANTLRACVMRLRRALGTAAGARLVTSDRGYLVEADEQEVDALLFARAYREGAAAHAAGQWAAASAALARGLGLWRGEPLADVPSQLLRDAHAPALLQARLQARHWRIDADLRLGGGAELIPELLELTAAEPLREQSHALLMTALAGSGRTAEALAAYQNARAILVRELGIEPGPELRDLHERILAGAEPSRRGVAPASADASAALVPRQLPAATAHFAGRAAELTALHALLGQLGAGPGVATISAIGGMGGIGKTALAVHWAHQVADRFPDGQLYVNLRGFGSLPPLTSAEALCGFLYALRDPGKPLPPDPDALGALYRSLMAGRRMLVLLDNAHDEEQVRPLLPGSEGCLTLITSRNQLPGLVTTSGAVPLRLSLFAEPEATELLARRLGRRAVADEPAAVGQLIASCGGLPLALSIAAARVSLAPRRSMAAVARQIGQSGLDALASADPYADLRSVFAWSYQRLSPGAARLFRLLPFLPGADVSADAIASLALGPDATALLAELTDANLVEQGQPERFRLHDLIARYARELSELTDTERERSRAVERILTWYLAVTVVAAGPLDPLPAALPHADAPSPKPAGLDTRDGAIRWLETELGNLTAAAAMAAELGLDALTIALARAVRNFLDLRALWPDLRRICLAAIAAARRVDDADTEAFFSKFICHVYESLGTPEQGIASGQRALAIRVAQGDLSGQGGAHGALGSMHFSIGRVDDAIGHYRQAIALMRRAGNCQGEGVLLSNLGWVYQRAERLDAALDCYLASRRIATALADPYLAGGVAANLAGLYLILGRVDEAIAAGTEAIRCNEYVGNVVELANAHHATGDALLQHGRPDQARSHWADALAGYQRADDPRAALVTAKLSSRSGPA